MLKTLGFSMLNIELTHNIQGKNPTKKTSTTTL